jgi:hypothetical protein
VGWAEKRRRNDDSFCCGVDVSLQVPGVKALVGSPWSYLRGGAWWKAESPGDMPIQELLEQCPLLLCPFLHFLAMR